MTKKHMAWTLALAALVAPLAHAAQEGVCESQDGNYRECRMPFSGNAQLSQQLSSATCEQGRTWGQRSSGVVWVSGGCRARFTQADTGWGWGEGQTLRCESADGQRKVCRFNAHARGQVRLSRQLSKTDCVQGRNWGSAGNGGVWVSGGCRAEFEVTTSNTKSAQTVRCSSQDGATSYCDWNRSWGQPVLQRQLSSTACEQGRTWGYGMRGLWVSGGCRAEFAPGGGKTWQQGSGSQTVRCSSHDGATSYCDWNRSWGQPVLQRQLSSATCEQGRTWGYGLRGLWVSGGCRAEFAPGGSAWQQGSSSQTVRCSSHDGATSYCDWNRSWGQPRLLRQLSNTACEQGRTWGYGLRGLWVSNGCRGEFGN